MSTALAHRNLPRLLLQVREAAILGPGLTAQHAGEVRAPRWGAAPRCASFRR